MIRAEGASPMTSGEVCAKSNTTANTEIPWEKGGANPMILRFTEMYRDPDHDPVVPPILGIIIFLGLGLAYT